MILSDSLASLGRELAVGIMGDSIELDPTPAWRWIAENFIVRDGDTGKATRYVVYPWTARMLLDAFPPGSRELPYNLMVISTVKKCVAPETKVLTDDLRWVPAGSLRPGDGLLAFDENTRTDKRGGSRRYYRTARVVSTGTEVRRCRRLTLADGTEIIASMEHPWLTRENRTRQKNGRHGSKGSPYTTTAIKWQTTDTLRPGYVLTRFLPTWEEGSTFDDGWVSGFLDGEGHVKPDCTDVSVGQRDNGALDRFESIVNEHGFGFKKFYQQRLSGPYAGKDYSIWQTRVSGRQNAFHMLGRYRPARMLENILPRLDKIGMLYSMDDVEIVSIEDLDHPVTTLETSTGTYFAEGFAAHNSGKTTTHAAILAYLAFVRAPAGSEMFVFANSLEQSVGRVFSMLTYAAGMSPKLRESVRGEPLETILRLTNGTTVKAQAAKAANIAGANPYYSGYTELWGYVHEKERRAWDEMTPPPTVRNSIRVVDTYAGYEGESDLLNNIEDELKAGKRLYADGYTLPADYLGYAESMSRSKPELAPFLMPDRVEDGALVYDDPIPCYVSESAGYYGFWDEGEEARRMPWQKGERGKRYYRQQEASGMLEGSFDRLHLNKRAKRGGQFVDPMRWGMLEEAEPWRPGDRYPVVLAIDSAKNDDYMAMIGTRMRDGRPEECYCQVWEPKPDPRYKGKLAIRPSDAFDEMVRLRAAGMRIIAVAYDPHQFHDVALKAESEGFNMVEFSQGPQRELADSFLRRLILTGGMAHTHTPALQSAIEAADVKEKRGAEGDAQRYRIVKGSGKVDPLVALSMSLWTATSGKVTGDTFEAIEGFGASGLISSSPMTGYQEDMPERQIDDLADEWGDTGGMFIGGGE